MVNNEATTVRPPISRKLRAYAFDPSLSLVIDTADINSMTYKVNWEELQPGPSGEYVEVIDFDPTIKKFFRPVNLNAPYLLAQDGLDPSESNPQFHQQMVYAVARPTFGTTPVMSRTISPQSKPIPVPAIRLVSTWSASLN